MHSHRLTHCMWESHFLNVPVTTTIHVCKPCQNKSFPHQFHNYFPTLSCLPANKKVYFSIYEKGFAIYWWPSKQYLNLCTELVITYLTASSYLLQLQSLPRNRRHSCMPLTSQGQSFLDVTGAENMGGLGYIDRDNNMQTRVPIEMKVIPWKTEKTCSHRNRMHNTWIHPVCSTIIY